MRIVLAGAHGQIARRLGRLLSARGDTVVGIIRNAAHESDVIGDGVDPVVLELETAHPDQVAAVVEGADAVVFAAGAGPGSGIARKDTVDRGAAVLLADAAELSGVRRYLLVSSMGVDSVADGTGLVRLARHVQRGSVPRDDVAAVLAALPDAGSEGAVLELIGGETPVEEAVAAALSLGARA